MFVLSSFVNLVLSLRVQVGSCTGLGKGRTPFKGGGTGVGLIFFLTTSCFFSFLHNKLFFSKVNCNKVFYEKITH